MLIEGEADYRTPPASGGEQMFRALEVSQDSDRDGALPRRIARAVAIGQCRSIAWSGCSISWRGSTNICRARKFTLTTCSSARAQSVRLVAHTHLASKADSL